MRAQQKSSTSPEENALLTLRKGLWGTFASFAGSPSMETWHEVYIKKKKRLIFTFPAQNEEWEWRGKKQLKDWRHFKKGITWELTPCAVRPSAPIMPPSRGIEIPGRVGEEVWGKGQADVGDSWSLERVLPRGTGFKGGRGSVWRASPGTIPPMVIRDFSVNDNPTTITHFIFNLLLQAFQRKLDMHSVLIWVT